MNKLKSEKNPLHILAVFRKAIKNKFVFRLWQTHEEAQSPNFGLVNSVNEKDSTFTILPKDPLTPFTFDIKEQLYLLEDKIELLFKEEIQEVQPALLRLKLPKSLHFYFNRKEIRIPMSHNERKEIVIRNMANSMMNRLRLLDISSQGAGIKFHQNHYYTFKQGDILMIGQISTVNFNPPLKANIVYVREIKTDKNPFKLYRLGMRFENKIPPHQLAQIIEL